MNFPSPWLHHGDCIEWLGLLPDNSVDACVSDPPYGLSTPPNPADVLRAWLAGEEFLAPSAGGFMGRAWDAFVPGPELWREVYRVLKPGAHVVAFAATRTVDWTSLALRLSGFEIRDQIDWAYFCLDEETEILTDQGWARYNEPIVGRHALCFDTDDGSFRWGQIDAQPVFDFEGTAFAVRGDRTDQLVTGAHRCVVERGGGFGFEYAQHLARSGQANVPVVEDLRGLLASVPVPDERAGCSEPHLLARVSFGAPVCPEGPERTTGRDLADTDLLGMRCGVRAAEVMGPRGTVANVFAALQREGPSQGSRCASEPWGWSDLASRERFAIGEDDRLEQPGLEGGSDAVESSGELPDARAARSVPAAPVLDGQDERLRAGASPRGRGGDRPSVAADGGRPPRRPQPAEQRSEQPDVVRDEPGSQALRSTRFAESDLVRVEPVAYRGKVWCVTVPTGAFVARRMGKVFVTGNSGFPKSVDVSKLIDNKLGAEREEMVAAPASDAAKRWAGWGTGVKPCFEPAVLARKPLSGTIAENVLEHGVGGLNIRGTSFADGSPEWFGPNERLKIGSMHKSNSVDGDLSYRSDQLLIPSEAGRWPANIVCVPKPSRGERERGTLGLPPAPVEGHTSPETAKDRPRAGTGRTQIEGGIRNNHPCLHPDALVMTPGGYRPIKQVAVGDLVYAADGKFHTVEHVSRHAYTSPDLFDIEVIGTNYRTRASDNHPFLVWRPTRKRGAVVGGEVLWLEAQELQAGDYTMTPVLNEDTTVLEGVPQSEDFWFLFGLYLAEGIIQKQGHGEGGYPSFSLHKDEAWLVERIRSYFDSKASVSVYQKGDSKGVQVTAFCAETGALFLELGGKLAHAKRLSDRVWRARPEQLRALFDGYIAGDGSDVRNHKQAKTVSLDLAAQLCLLSERIGYKANLHTYAPKPGAGIGGRKFKTQRDVHQVLFYDRNQTSKKRKPSRPTHLQHDGNTFTLRYIKRVTKVPYVGDVVNLSVEGSPTFQTAVGMSHNTVKPVRLMRWLCRLVTPPGALVIDPFLGSGTTGIAAVLEGFRFGGAELGDRFFEIAKSRVLHARDFPQKWFDTTPGTSRPR